MHEDRTRQSLGQFDGDLRLVSLPPRIMEMSLDEHQVSMWSRYGQPHQVPTATVEALFKNIPAEDMAKLPDDVKRIAAFKAIFVAEMIIRTGSRPASAFPSTAQIISENMIKRAIQQVSDEAQS